MNEVEYITAQNFQPFGVLLEFPPDPPDSRFHVVITEPAQPWRLAVYRVRERSCNQLECHPDSLESFEPVSGTGLLIVAPQQDPASHKIFLLDKPVCLHKGVWHQMITLSSETIVKIAENLEVSSKFFSLPRQISTRLEG